MFYLIKRRKLEILHRRALNFLNCRAKIGASLIPHPFQRHRQTPGIGLVKIIS